MESDIGMKKETAAKYFNELPTQWGLRGDPFLWDEMKVSFEKINLPVSSREFERLLHKFFQELTSERPEKGKTIFIERYNKGGMSGGFVSCDFWLEKGFSLLIQRYIEEIER